MNGKLIALKQLDEQLGILKKDFTAIMLPAEGWIRTIRKAFGLTIKQLARRLGVDPSRVVKIETAEIAGAITLRTLQGVAETLECQFVYGFIPKTTLEGIVKKQAEFIALEQLKRISHTMDLELQSISQQWFEEQVNDLAKELLEHSWKHLWETS